MRGGVVECADGNESEVRPKKWGPGECQATSSHLINLRLRVISPCVVLSLLDVVFTEDGDLACRVGANKVHLLEKLRLVMLELPDHGGDVTTCKCVCLVGPSFRHSLLSHQLAL